MPNRAINLTSPKLPQVIFTLALAHGGAYSTHVKNPIFVVASFAKVVLPLVLRWVLLVSSWRWCRLIFPAMLLALGGCCVGLGSNLALKRTASSRRLPWFVSTTETHLYFAHAF